MAETEPSRTRILAAAEALFARDGFAATPTSRIAERAGVPKGLVHYYFPRKPDLLTALVERLPDERVDAVRLVVPGDVAASLCRLVAHLDRTLEGSEVLSHLLWREADTHPAVLDAMRARRRRVVAAIGDVVRAAAPSTPAARVDSASRLLAAAVSHRHSIARHGDTAPMDEEIELLASALT